MGEGMWRSMQQDLLSENYDGKYLLAYADAAKCCYNVLLQSQMAFKF